MRKIDHFNIKYLYYVKFSLCQLSAILQSFIILTLFQHCFSLHHY